MTNESRIQPDSRTVVPGHSVTYHQTESRPGVKVTWSPGSPQREAEVRALYEQVQHEQLAKMTLGTQSWRNAAIRAVLIEQGVVGRAQLSEAEFGRLVNGLMMRLDDPPYREVPPEFQEAHNLLVQALLSLDDSHPDGLLDSAKRAAKHLEVMARLQLAAPNDVPVAAPKSPGLCDDAERRIVGIEHQVTELRGNRDVHAKVIAELSNRAEALESTVKALADVLTSMQDRARAMPDTTDAPAMPCAQPAPDEALRAEQGRCLSDGCCGSLGSVVQGHRPCSVCGFRWSSDYVTKKVVESVLGREHRP